MDAPDFGRCTCHDVREWNASGSVFGSLASFGAECGACIAANDWYAEEERRASLTPAQRVAEDVAARWWRAVRHLPYRRPGAPAGGEPPF